MKIYPNGQPLTFPKDSPTVKISPSRLVEWEANVGEEVSEIIKYVQLRTKGVIVLEVLIMRTDLTSRLSVKSFRAALPELNIS